LVLTLAAASLAGAWLVAGRAEAQSAARDRDRERARQERPGDWEVDESGKARVRQPTARVVEPHFRAPEWRLGVVSDDTSTGVQIREVVRGSAAYRAGLERGDVIVAVGGYQIGIVHGRRYDLADELQARASDRGHVQLLVQNARNRELLNLEVELDRAPQVGLPIEYATLRGSVTIRERILLPGRSVLVLRLLKVDRRGGESVLLAQRSYSSIDRMPMGFELRYPTHLVDRGDRYEIQAEISLDGRPLFVSDGPIPCLHDGRADDVDIVLRRWQ
jgi:uncharacterized lipoprotein YbaY